MGSFDLNLLLVNSILQGGGKLELPFLTRSFNSKQKKLPGAYDPVKY